MPQSNHKGTRKNKTTPSKKNPAEAIQQDLAALVCETSAQGIIVTDPDLKILSINPAFTRITGYTPEDALGKKPSILQSGLHDSAFYQIMWDDMNTCNFWEGEIWNKQKNGDIFLEWLSIRKVTDHTGQALYYIGIFSDITQRKKIEEKISFRANHDLLTGLVNRTIFIERLEQAIKQSQRNEKNTAVLFVDLDGFKKVNDTLGHIIGDLVLKETAQRLLACVRETDTVARAGGDEFLILLTNILKRQEATQVADKMLTALSQPFTLEKHVVFISGSCGITVSPDDGVEVITLFKNADMAMYKAKASGRNCFHFFTKKMKTSAEETTVLESELKKAIRDEQLVIHYQPILNLHTLETISLEALVRWKHPAQGLLYPGKVFPLAEKAEIASQIDRYVIHMACQQMQSWTKRYQLDLSLSVNVSNQPFNDETFLDFLKATTKTTGFSEKALVLEIPENRLRNSDKKTLKQLRRLKKAGIKIAVDDFGTGISSLSMLFKYPIDLLKIDRALIENIESSKKTQALVKAICNLAHQLNIEVIAKGIETKATFLFLKEIDYDWGQGHFFEKALSAEHYEAALKSKNDAA